MTGVPINIPYESGCMAGGMDGYVSKPIRGMDLFELIEHLLANKPAVNSPV